MAYGAVRIPILAFLVWAIQDPAPKADDVEFLTRLTQDLTAAAPTEAELKAFASDPDPAKRTKRIEQFLNSDGFADLWARRFADFLIGDPKEVRPTWVFGLAPEAPSRRAKDFQTWLRDQIKKDRPWNEIAAEILNARGKSEQNPAVGYHLALHRGKGHSQEFAEAVARQFMGVRLYCARCHDHPFDSWDERHYYGLAAFVARQRVKPYGTPGAFEHVELTYADKGETYVGNNSANVAKPVFPFGGSAPVGDGVDRVATLVDLMTSKTNTQFARTLVNRVWGWLFGRGIVDPVDDFNASNLPAISGVLEPLATEFVANKYSIKHLVKSICRSERYERPGGWKKEMEQASLKATAWWRKKFTVPKPLKDPPPLKVTLTAPEAWVRVGSLSFMNAPSDSPISAAAHYFVPDKAKKALPALFRLGDLKGRPKTIEDQLEAWARQGLARKPKEEKLDGTFKTTVLDVSGPFTCQQGSAGPVPYRVLLATVQFADGPWFFELAGPAETVDGWREEFLCLLKTASR